MGTLGRESMKNYQVEKPKEMHRRTFRVVGGGKRRQNQDQTLPLYEGIAIMEHWVSRSQVSPAGKTEPQQDCLTSHSYGDATEESRGIPLNVPG
jgi:hypothetical protein